LNVDNVFEQQNLLNEFSNQAFINDN